MNKSISIQPVSGIIFSGIPSRCFPPFLAVWGGQTERETPLCNIKLHAARFGVCVGLAALVGVLSGVGGKPFLQVGVVGADMDKWVFLVKPNIGGLFLLFQSCFHKLSFLRPCYAVGAFFGCFLRLLTWEKRRFFNRKCSGDTFLVQSVPIVKYSVFTALDRQTQKNANSRQVSLSAACRGMFLRFCD